MEGTTFNRQMFTNYRLWIALGVVIGLQAGSVYFAPLKRLFGTVPLTLADWAICAGIASTVLVAEELRELGLRVVPWLRSRHLPTIVERHA